MIRSILRRAARRRGSQIAEASIVYPVIIAVSVMSVAAMAHFYSCSANAAAMSIDARSTADETAHAVERIGGMYDAVGGSTGSVQGAESDNYYDAVYGKDSDMGRSYSLEEDNGLLYGKVTASYRAQISMFGIFSASRGDVYTIKRSAINEAQLIWKRQLIGDIFGSITGNDAPGSSEGS